MKNQVNVVQWYIKAMEKGKDANVILQEYLKQKSELNAAQKSLEKERISYQEMLEQKRIELKDANDKLKKMYTVAVKPLIKEAKKN